MQTTSEVYKSIVRAANADGRSFAVEVKLEIYSSDGNEYVGTYGEDVLISGSINGEMFPSVSVGGAKARQIKVEMLLPSTTIPRMAMLKPYFRISYEGETSEWILKGIYYVDTRHVDIESGILELHGYDAMLKTEQPYCPDGSGTWPRDMATVVFDICSALGVTLDVNTYITTDYMCQLDTTMTMREYLGYIAAAHAGVFAFNDLGKLALLPLYPTPSVEDLGTRIQSLKTSPLLDAIGRIEIYATEDDYFAYPESSTGLTLSFDCPWGSEAMAQGVYNMLRGYVYRPFEATGALLSPAVELGDGVTIIGVLRNIYKQDITFGHLLSSDIAAPSDEEIEHEYHYTSTEKKLARQVSKLTSELRVTAESISGLVEDVEGNYAEFQQTAEELTARVESAEGTATEAQQTAEGFSQRITDAEGNIVEIEASMEGVAYTSSLADGTTVINGGCITTGTIDASKATISNLTVTNANIVSLDAGKITVSGQSLGGSSSYLDAIYSARGTITNLSSMQLALITNSPDEGETAFLTAAGVQIGSDTLISWRDIISGGTSTAVFG